MQRIIQLCYVSSWLLDVEDGSWDSEEDDESPMTLMLTADQPVYDNGVLTVNISWSAGQSQALPPW